MAKQMEFKQTLKPYEKIEQQIDFEDDKKQVYTSL